MPHSQPDPYFARLNKAQKEAVERTEGPLLILAGAGTGKTRVLTSRIAHILRSGRAYPSQILSVTFTNKAAREMKERIQEALGHPVDGMWLGTFHSVCARMLRQHAEQVGLKRDFIILDSDDQIRLFKQLMIENGVDFRKWAPQALLNRIQSWKDKAIFPQDLKNSPQHAADIADGKLPLLYQLYQNKLLKLNACDFGDLMAHMVRLFKTHPGIADYYREKFRYILVDEYQDTNVIQYLWLRALSEKPDKSVPNIACVGDDDQSIYSWRGAEIENILRFQKDFPTAHIVRLEENYRSTSMILGAASALIARNEGRLGKTLRPADQERIGEKILLVELDDSESESAMIADYAQQERKKNTPFSEIAVLVRASFQTRSIEEAFLRERIPYQIVGGMKFYERAEIRDAVAYLRALHSRADDLAFERIVNVPKRGVGNATLKNLRDYSESLGLSLQDGMNYALQEKKIKGKSALKLAELNALFVKAAQALETESLPDICEMLLEESGYFAMLRQDPLPDAPGRLENLQELLRALGEFETLESFLEHIALTLEMENAQESKEKISIMTLHGAKGLEFDCVFLPGWEEGVFPSGRSLDENGRSALEEERRLAYVGITRARKIAIISHAARRRIYGQWQDCIPSRFIKEIPSAYLSRRTLWRNAHGGARPYGQNYGAFKRTSQSPAESSSSSGALSVGAKVAHVRFGVGYVVETDTDQATVRFENGQTRHLMTEYLKRV